MTWEDQLGTHWCHKSRSRLPQKRPILTARFWQVFQAPPFGHLLPLLLPQPPTAAVLGLNPGLLGAKLVLPGLVDYVNKLNLLLEKHVGKKWRTDLEHGSTFLGWLQCTWFCHQRSWGKKIARLQYLRPFGCFLRHFCWCPDPSDWRNIPKFVKPPSISKKSLHYCFRKSIAHCSHEDKHMTCAPSGLMSVAITLSWLDFIFVPKKNINPTFEKAVLWQDTLGRRASRSLWCLQHFSHLSNKPFWTCIVCRRWFLLRFRLLQPASIRSFNQGPGRVARWRRSFRRRFGHRCDGSASRGRFRSGVGRVGRHGVPCPAGSRSQGTLPACCGFWAANSFCPRLFGFLVSKWTDWFIDGFERFDPLIIRTKSFSVSFSLTHSPCLGFGLGPDLFGLLNILGTLRNVSGFHWKGQQSGRPLARGDDHQRRGQGPFRALERCANELSPQRSADFGENPRAYHVNINLIVNYYVFRYFVLRRLLRRKGGAVVVQNTPATFCSVLSCLTRRSQINEAGRLTRLWSASAEGGH